MLAGGFGTPRIRFMPSPACRTALLTAAAFALSCALTHTAADAAELPAPPEAIARMVSLSLVVKDLDKPVHLASPRGDPRLFVVEKRGRIRVVKGGTLVERPFLDLTKRTSTGSEQGLLGLAFHPKYAANGRFFVNFTDRKGDTHVVELRASKTDPELADPSSEREVLVVKQPYPNHNGGGVEFGPDGRLYVGMGDGGSGGDPHRNGQNSEAPLAKMLRIDVDGEKATPEIVALGLRNPWRYAFDRKTGDLFIADVGQNKYEEIDWVAGGKLTGQNFGWNVYEGSHCFKESAACTGKGFTRPVVEYDHQTGCSITGGYVYRGKALPELDGAYFYSDYCTALLRSFRMKDGTVADHFDWKAALDPDGKLAAISSFGLDSDGELYLLSLEGKVFKFTRKAAAK